MAVSQLTYPTCGYVSYQLVLDWFFPDWGIMHKASVTILGQFPNILYPYILISLGYIPEGRLGSQRVGVCLTLLETFTDIRGGFAA